MTLQTCQLSSQTSRTVPQASGIKSFFKSRKGVLGTFSGVKFHVGPRGTQFGQSDPGDAEVPHGRWGRGRETAARACGVNSKWPQTRARRHTAAPLQGKAGPSARLRGSEQLVGARGLRQTRRVADVGHVAPVSRKLTRAAATSGCGTRQAGPREGLCPLTPQTRAATPSPRHVCFCHGCQRGCSGSRFDVKDTQSPGRDRAEAPPFPPRRPRARRPGLSAPFRQSGPRRCGRAVSPQSTPTALVQSAPSHRAA